MNQLYKRNKRGQLKVWWYEIDRTKGPDACVVTIYSGLEGGKIKEHYKHLTPTKQQPDAVERAKKLFATKEKDKRKDGYTEDREAALSAETLKKPMHLKRIDIDDVTEDMFPIWVEVKQNGVCGWHDRTLSHLLSRTGEIQDVAHIREQLNLLIAPYPEIRFAHFEILVPGEKVTTINGWIRKPCPETKRLLGKVFDLVPADGRMPQTERIEMRREVFTSQNAAHCTHLGNVASVLVTSLAQFKCLYNEAEERGEEGLVGRSTDEFYHFDNKTSRGDYAFKCKPLISEEFKVVDISLDQRTVEVNRHMVQYNLIEFWCITEDGGLFKVIPSWDQEKRNRWGHRYLNGSLKVSELGPLTVEYRELTSKDLPFHAVGIDFRTDL